MAGWGKRGKSSGKASGGGNASTEAKAVEVEVITGDTPLDPKAAPASKKPRVSQLIEELEAGQKEDIKNYSKVIGAAARAAQISDAALRSMGVERTAAPRPEPSRPQLPGNSGGKKKSRFGAVIDSLETERKEGIKQDARLMANTAKLIQNARQAVNNMTEDSGKSLKSGKKRKSLKGKS